MLEALVLKCKPIIPNFDEAIKTQKKNVYFKKFQKKFFIAKSKLDLSKKINKCINNADDRKFNYYFGSDDIFKYYIKYGYELGGMAKSFPDHADDLLEHVLINPEILLINPEMPITGDRFMIIMK